MTPSKQAVFRFVCRYGGISAHFYIKPRRNGILFNMKKRNCTLNLYARPEFRHGSPNRIYLRLELKAELINDEYHHFWKQAIRSKKKTRNYITQKSRKIPQFLFFKR